MRDICKRTDVTFLHPSRMVTADRGVGRNSDLCLFYRQHSSLILNLIKEKVGGWEMMVGEMGLKCGKEAHVWEGLGDIMERRVHGCIYSCLSCQQE